MRGASSGVMEAKGDVLHGPNTGVTMDLDDTSNIRISISMRNHDAPPTRTALNAPYYAPTPPSSRNPLAGWVAYPPQPAPDFEDVSSKRPLGEMPDIELFTYRHVEQSTALREWMEQLKEARESLGSERRDRKMERLREYWKISVEAPDVASRAAAQFRARQISRLAIHRQDDIEKDRELLSELLRTYEAFLSVEKAESYISARRRASEILASRHQQQPQPRELSRTERLLGSDGSAPLDHGLSTDVQLYFVGSPLQLYKIPFADAVAAGIEDVGISPLPLSQVLPQAVVPLPGAHSPPVRPVSNQPRNLMVPDWFAFYKMRDAEEDPETGWKNLLNSIGNLENTIKQNDASERPKWDKEWHEPHPSWPYEHRRKHGGWWKCRSGRDAPRVEAWCMLCHKDEPSTLDNTAQTSDPKEQLKTIMDAIDEAMREVAKRDKVAVSLREEEENTGVGLLPSPMEDLHISAREDTGEERGYHQREGRDSLVQGTVESDDDVTH
ncbi:hypothetical protein K449DRAFT_34286 [Hypoxylon sp. EC38]|nr:hypothetical protein K449DRAFT_34286 [Hypoxylon sp. EC38]